jgi:hypothetical protein
VSGHQHHRRQTVGALTVGIAATTLGLASVLTTALAATPTPGPVGAATTAGAYADLTRGGTGACAGAYRLGEVQIHGRPVCTHGPDVADPLSAEMKGNGGRGGGKTSPSPSPSTTATASPEPATTPTGGRCGSDGPRVQAIYAHAADVTDRFASLHSSLQQWLANVDDIFNISAAETGGVRHVRFLTDASCVPVITDVTMSATGDDSFSATINELKSQGFTRTDRKYVVWVDADVYCGIGTVQQDDAAASTNLNNSGPSYGRTDTGCWGGSTEAHELEHNLGGVQMSAPHSNGAWHCTDEYELMCYQENSKPMTYPCPLAHANVLDCGHDDYFSTAPVPGSYLAGHWNSASSAYLTSSG